MILCVYCLAIHWDGKKLFIKIINNQQHNNKLEQIKILAYLNNSLFSDAVLIEIIYETITIGKL